MDVRQIFVGIDLGDKNSVARIAVDREKSERFGFVNNRAGASAFVERGETTIGRSGRGDDRDGIRSIGVRIRTERRSGRDEDEMLGSGTDKDGEVGGTTEAEK
jgi:hypothetical protein